MFALPDKKVWNSVRSSGRKTGDIQPRKIPKRRTGHEKQAFARQFLIFFFCQRHFSYVVFKPISMYQLTMSTHLKKTSSWWKWHFTINKWKINKCTWMRRFSAKRKVRHSQAYEKKTRHNMVLRSFICTQLNGKYFYWFSRNHQWHSTARLWREFPLRFFLI